MTKLCEEKVLALGKHAVGGEGGMDHMTAQGGAGSCSGWVAPLRLKLAPMKKKKGKKQVSKTQETQNNNGGRRQPPHI